MTPKLVLVMIAVVLTYYCVRFDSKALFGLTQNVYLVLAATVRLLACASCTSDRRPAGSASLSVLLAVILASSASNWLLEALHDNKIPAFIITAAPVPTVEVSTTSR